MRYATATQGLTTAFRAASALAALTAGVAVVSAACSSHSGCTTQCAPGNACINDGKGPACHKVCTQQDQCPFGWYCNDGLAGDAGAPANWCVPNTTSESLTEAGATPWGVPCLATQGEKNNEACDVAAGFVCYGQSPADANAFCTILGCSQDSDCPGGWWCETVNTKPNVTTANRTFGSTRTVCTPRQYCATCVMDHDCPAALNGTQQHCIEDSQGNGFCTPQCSTGSDCNTDARCVLQESVCTPPEAADGGAGISCQSDDDCPPINDFYSHCDQGTCTNECGSASDCLDPKQKCTALSVCVPYAGVCLGDGSFCSPCRSDGDCQDGGDCMYAGDGYSTERFCSAPTVGKCPATAGEDFTVPGAGVCPAAPAGSSAAVKGKGGVACTFTSTGTERTPPPAPAAFLANQCIAFVSFFSGANVEELPGCWTPNGAH